MSGVTEYGSVVERTTLPSMNQFMRLIPNGIRRLGSINEGYHVAYSDPQSLKIFEYCEGDFTVTTAKDNESFNSEVFKVQWFIVDNC